MSMMPGYDALCVMHNVRCTMHIQRSNWIMINQFQAGHSAAATRPAEECYDTGAVLVGVRYSMHDNLYTMLDVQCFRHDAQCTVYNAHAKLELNNGQPVLYRFLTQANRGVSRGQRREIDARPAPTEWPVASAIRPGAMVCKALRHKSSYSVLILARDLGS